MDKQQDPEAAETAQTTNVPAVDLPRLVLPSSFVNADDEYPTPETDAMEWDDAMCDPRYTVESDFARTLERQRDGAFALIDYTGELLGVPKQEHKSAHGFAILLAIKKMKAQREQSTSVLKEIIEQAAMIDANVKLPDPFWDAYRAGEILLENADVEARRK